MQPSNCVCVSVCVRVCIRVFEEFYCSKGKIEIVKQNNELSVICFLFMKVECENWYLT